MRILRVCVTLLTQSGPEADIGFEDVIEQPILFAAALAAILFALCV